MNIAFMISASSFAYLSYRLYVKIITDNSHFVNRFFRIHIKFIGFILSEHITAKVFVANAQNQNNHRTSAAASFF